MARLAGKVAFITGGGGGIGRATAERFAEEGAKVVIAEINSETGAAAAEAARARAADSGGDAHFVQCDVTDRASVERAIAETVARFGKLDTLHNNAGGSTRRAGHRGAGGGVLAGDQTRSLWYLSLFKNRDPGDHQGRRRLGH